MRKIKNGDYVTLFDISSLKNMYVTDRNGNIVTKTIVTTDSFDCLGKTYVVDDVLSFDNSKYQSFRILDNEGKYHYFSDDCVFEILECENLKPGMKVRLKTINDLKAENYSMYENDTYIDTPVLTVSSMIKYLGKVVTIKIADPDFRIEEDEGEFIFSNCLIAEVVNEPCDCANCEYKNCNSNNITDNLNDVRETLDELSNIISEAVDIIGRIYSQIN